MTLIASVRPYLNIRNEAVSMVEQQASYILEFKKTAHGVSVAVTCISASRGTSEVSPIVGKLQRGLHKAVRAQLVLLCYIFSIMGEHQDLHVQVVDHSGEAQKREQ